MCETVLCGHGWHRWPYVSVVQQVRWPRHTGQRHTSPRTLLAPCLHSHINLGLRPLRNHRFAVMPQTVNRGSGRHVNRSETSEVDSGSGAKSTAAAQQASAAWRGGFLCPACFVPPPAPSSSIPSAVPSFWQDSAGPAPLALALQMFPFQSPALQTGADRLASH